MRTLCKAAQGWFLVSDQHSRNIGLGIWCQSQKLPEGDNLGNCLLPIMLFSPPPTALKNLKSTPEMPWPITPDAA